ncbi:MAG: LPXTG cell wall anchor domain-containing protein [Erysipelotrichaceae bacterium]|nr:LPXTG cell wall anchor domain-containing protein [Erysipelotrichaceae bacterium]
MKNRIMAIIMTVMSVFMILPVEYVQAYSYYGTPNTGDTNNLTLWIGLLIGALVAAAVAIYLIRKKDKEK